MRKILTASVTALALAATALGAAAPAEAQRWHGGGYRGHYYGGRGGGWAVGAGLLGLAAGAAIASDRHYYGYGYAPAYGYPPAYGYAPGYYAPPPAYYYGARGYCRSDWRWDGWAHRYVRVRYCD